MITDIIHIVQESHPWPPFGIGRTARVAVCFGRVAMHSVITLTMRSRVSPLAPFSLPVGMRCPAAAVRECVSEESGVDPSTQQVLLTAVSPGFSEVPCNSPTCVCVCVCVCARAGVWSCSCSWSRSRLYYGGAQSLHYAVRSAAHCEHCNQCLAWAVRQVLRAWCEVAFEGEAEEVLEGSSSSLTGMYASLPSLSPSCVCVSRVCVAWWRAL